MIKIKHSHGPTETHTGLDNALASLRSAYGDEIVTSDLTHLASDRALVWSSAEDSIDDDGRLAVASLSAS